MNIMNIIDLWSIIPFGICQTMLVLILYQQARRRLKRSHERDSTEHFLTSLAAPEKFRKKIVILVLCSILFSIGITPLPLMLSGVYFVAKGVKSAISSSKQAQGNSLKINCVLVRNGYSAPARCEIIIFKKSYSLESEFNRYRNAADMAKGISDYYRRKDAERNMELINLSFIRARGREIENDNAVTAKTFYGDLTLKELKSGSYTLYACAKNGSQKVEWVKEITADGQITLTNDSSCVISDD